IEMRRRRGMHGWGLVTGAARRIGRAIALELAASGWDVVLHYNRSEQEAMSLAEDITALGRRTALGELCLARGHLVAKRIPSLAQEFGALSGLVNNASLFEPDSKDADGHLHMAINAEAPRLLSEAFYQQIPANGTGAIVNLLDGMPPEKGLDGYNKSKIAL